MAKRIGGKEYDWNGFDVYESSREDCVRVDFWSRIQGCVTGRSLLIAKKDYCEDGMVLSYTEPLRVLKAGYEVR